MQCATIDFARNVLGMDDANSTEFTDDTRHPVICLMSEQENVEDMGGTMRLGSYPCDLAPGSKAYEAYGASRIDERHRHRYEFNNHYRSLFTERGFVLSGLSPDKKLVEVVELNGHPWYVAVQYHPEFKSKPTQAHPLFREFVRAARDRHKALTGVSAESLVSGNGAGGQTNGHSSAKPLAERSASYSC
jgi:CTP synthase